MSSKPEKVHAGKRNSNRVDRPSNVTSRGRMYMLHAPGHYTEKCKVLRDYRENTRANGLTRETTRSAERREAIL